MSPGLLLTLIVLAVAAPPPPAASSQKIGKPGCPTRCGSVDIPYPFGIAGTVSYKGDNCSLPGFEIICAGKNNDTPAPVLADTKNEVLSLSVMPRPEVRLQLPVAWSCYNSTGGSTGYSNGTVNFNKAGVYRISDTGNELFVLGCNTLAYTNSGPPGRHRYSFYAGCVAYCKDSQSAHTDGGDGQCAGVGCCHVDVPRGLTDNWMFFETGWSHANQESFSPCDYAFIVEKGHYDYKVSDLTSMPTNQTMPLRLDWAIRSSNISSVSVSCAAAKQKQGYACVSNHSECIDSTNGPGYFCNCSQGYEGNPYILDGCTNIDECARRDFYHCHGHCWDTEGSYDCTCRLGYHSSDPKELPCTPKFPLAAQLALGIGLGISLLILAILFVLMMRQKRRINEYFKKNGGSVLQKVDNIKIFTKDELDKITKNNSEVLGQGGFGKVYKGTLEDNTIVAVKESIEVNDAQKEDFTNEVIVQSQMIHTNIIKLLGCCLEVDVPMLVYEFAANGNLQDILHGDVSRRVPLPLDLRLDIAIQSAEGLRYMHSYAKRTVRHGDIKPANILLDDKFIPKISDFGTSKLLTVDKDFTMFPVGSMGYIDPVFYRTGHLTKKSDVYSFGVVLLELISRKPTIYGENLSIIIEFQKAYRQEKSGRAMFDKEIATKENIFILEEIGKLAMECLKEHVEERPDMNEVAEQLVMLRRARKHALIGTYDIINPQNMEDISFVGFPKSFGTDISISGSSTVPSNEEFISGSTTLLGSEEFFNPHMYSR